MGFNSLFRKEQIVNKKKQNKRKSENADGIPRTQSSSSQLSFSKTLYLTPLSTFAVTKRRSSQTLISLNLLKLSLIIAYPSLNNVKQQKRKSTVSQRHQAGISPLAMTMNQGFNWCLWYSRRVTLQSTLDVQKLD
ncbi:unnamed protein product [Lathyrus oleraceus]